jgi:hypothetical protein
MCAHAAGSCPVSHEWMFIKQEETGLDSRPVVGSVEGSADGRSPCFELLRDAALEEARSLPAERCRVRGAWTLRLTYQPNADERLFEYDVAIVQTEQQGAAYGFPGQLDHDRLGRLVGRDVRDCIRSGLSIENTACLDALCGSLPQHPVRTHVITGLSSDKAALRARIVVEEAVRLAGNRTGPIRIANIGTIGQIVHELVDRGCTVIPTDMEPGIIGRSLHGCTVLDGALHSEQAVRDCDIAIVTGMTMATGSLDGLLAAASETGTRILLVAETGAWIGERLLAAESVHCVVSEPFPFYIFSGPSTIHVFTRESPGPAAPPG